MLVDIRIAVSKPSAVDLARVCAEVPYDTISVEAVKGRLELEMMRHQTIVANAIITVSYNLDKGA